MALELIFNHCCSRPTTGSPPIYPHRTLSFKSSSCVPSESQTSTTDRHSRGKPLSGSQRLSCRTRSQTVSVSSRRIAKCTNMMSDTVRSSKSHTLERRLTLIRIQWKPPRRSSAKKASRACSAEDSLLDCSRMVFRDSCSPFCGSCSRIRECCFRVLVLTMTDWGDVVVSRDMVARLERLRSRCW